MLSMMMISLIIILDFICVVFVFTHLVEATSRSNTGSGRTCDVIPDHDVRAAQTIWRYMTLNHTLRKCDVILALGSYDVRVARRAADLYLEGYGDWVVMSGNTGNLTKNLWTVPEADIFRDVAVGRGVPRDRILLEREATNTGGNVKNTYTLLSLLGLSPSSLLLVQKPYMERRAFATFLAQWPGMTWVKNDVDGVTSSCRGDVDSNSVVSVTSSPFCAQSCRDDVDSKNVDGVTSPNVCTQSHGSDANAPSNDVSTTSNKADVASSTDVNKQQRCTRHSKPSPQYTTFPYVIVTSPDVTLLEYPNDDVGSLSDVISVMLGDMQRIFLYGELGFQIPQEVPWEVETAYDYLRGTGRYDGYFQ